MVIYFPSHFLKIIFLLLGVGQISYKKPTRRVLQSILDAPPSPLRHRLPIEAMTYRMMGPQSSFSTSEHDASPYGLISILCILVKQFRVRV